MSVAHEALKRKKLRINQSYKKGEFVGRCVHLVTRVWRLLLDIVGIYGTAETVAPYIFAMRLKPNKSKIMHTVAGSVVFVAKPLDRGSNVGYF